MLEKVLLRLARNMGWALLLRMMPVSMALTFRRLSIRGSARIAISMNRAFDGMVGGFPCSLPPSFLSWPGKSGRELRIRIPRHLRRNGLSHTRLVPTFRGAHAYHPSRSTPLASALCTFVGKSTVAFFSCCHAAQLPLRAVIETALSFRPPYPR